MRNRFRILIASLVTLLLLSVLSAGTFPVSAAVNFTVTPNPVVYSIIQGNSSSKQLTITNTSGSTIQITSVTLGGNAPGSYSINGLPATPFDIASGDTENFNVVFSNGTAGVYLAKLTVSAGGDTANVALRGLATRGTGGNNEPSLAWIMTTFFGDVNTGLSNLDPGDDDPVTTTIHSVYGGYAPLIGDEVAAPGFVRADNGSPVTLQVIAAYGNNANPVARWGYYQPGNTGDRTEVFTVNNSPASNAQTLNPTTTGSLSFTPSVEPFGLYTIWTSFGNREVYSEDQFNTWEPNAAYRHKFRAYPIPGEANAYLVTWEEFTSGFDYNDVVVIMHNVQPSTGLPPMLVFENLDWQKMIAINSSNTQWLNTYLTFNGIKDHLLETDPFYKQHREVTLRIHNRNSVNTLNISSIAFNPATAWKAKNNETSLSIPPMGSYDLIVKFIEQQGTLGPRYGTMTLTTNDPANPNPVVKLGASYQTAVENANELDLPDIMMTYGFGIFMQNPNTGNYVAYGEEILSKNWHRADNSKPIYVVQLAAFHGTGTATVKLDFATSSDSAMSHDGNSYQSYFPLNQTLTGFSEMLINNKSDNFFFNIGGKTACSADCTDQHGIRVWRARDPQGNVMEDAYFVAQDYVGSGSSTNYDWNDNTVLVSNITPVTTYNPDLKTTVVPDPAIIKVNQTGTAIFSVFNKAAFPAADATFTVTLPNNSVYVGTDNPDCIYSAPVTINCDLGDNYMPNELHPEIVSVQFKPTSVGTGTVKVKGVVGTSSTEQSTSNNTINASFTVVQQFPPTAVADSYEATMNQTLNVPAATGLLTNDTDGNNDTLTASLVTDSANGDVTVNPDGSFTFVPDNNYFGNTTFTYRANDGIDNSAPATVTIAVKKDNFAPTAVTDSYTLFEDTQLGVNAAAGVMTNDSDQDAGDTLSVAVATQPSHGTLTFNADGSFTYVPTQDYNGSDSFTYTLSDNHNATDTGTVNLTITSVNDQPVAGDDIYNDDENQALIISAPGVLSNDNDVDVDTLIVSIASQPTHGSVSLNANGSFTYTPQSSFDGTDTFTYNVSDGHSGSDTATVTIVMIPIQDSPAAVDDVYTTQKNVTINANAASGVLHNDSDPDTGDTLTVVDHTNPTHGTLTMNPDGSFVYVPDNNYTGPDSFNYTINDSAANPDTASVSITVTTVNNAPAAVDDSYETDQNTLLEVAVANGLLANDSDQDNNALSVSNHTDPAHGELTLNEDGSFTYNPDTDFVGNDTFNYTLSDGQGGTDTGHVTISIDNQSPVGTPDNYSTNNNTSLTVNAPNGVLANDTDADGDTLHATLNTPASNGVASLNDDGSFTYTPNATFSGDDTFTYDVSDGQGGVDENILVTVHVGPAAPDLIVNGGFEVDDNEDKVPDEWTPKNLTKDKRKCNTEEKIVAFEGNCAFQFKGVPEENSKLQQIPDGSSLVAGDTLSFYAAVNGKKAVEGRARAIAKVIFGDQKVKLVLNFPGGKYDYTIFNDVSDPLPGTPTKIKVQIQYRRGANTGKFIIDQVRLLVNEGSETVIDPTRRIPGPGTRDGLLPLPDTRQPVPGTRQTGNGEQRKNG